MKRALLALLVLLLLYTGTYATYRSTHVERWERDGRDYVIFSNGALYYFFRSASLVDSRLTGMNFHIGPHQDRP